MSSIQTRVKIWHGWAWTRRMCVLYLSNTLNSNRFHHPLFAFSFLNFIEQQYQIQTKSIINSRLPSWHTIHQIEIFFFQPSQEYCTVALTFNYKDNMKNQNQTRTTGRNENLHSWTKLTIHTLRWHKAFSNLAYYFHF